MMSINKSKSRQKKKTFFAFGLAFLLLLVYFFLSARSPAPTTNPTKPSDTPNVAKEETPLFSTAPTQLYYRKIRVESNPALLGKKVSEVYLYDLKKNQNKLIFTDIDEDFTIQNVAGIINDKMIIFATPLNENAGDLWEVATDGSGAKKKIANSLVITSIKATAEKIIFVSYDSNVPQYTLWMMDKEGKNQKKILESDFPISDPVIRENGLAYISSDSNLIDSIVTINFDGSEKKEILKSKNASLSRLSYAKGKYVYLKIPKDGSDNANEIYLFDTTTGTEKRITQNNEKEEHPLISQNGEDLAFVKNNKIWLKNLNSGEEKVLTEGTQPLWF